jgi:uncharacterized membrane protein
MNNSIHANLPLFADQRRMASQRLTFIDILRGIACIWMIETHAVNAFLDAAYKNNSVFSILQISNGFVAVAFIFCAGAGFRLALDTKINDYISYGKPLWSYVRRLLFILAIGYSLQPPRFSFVKMLNFTPEQWVTFLDCNVLQLIVASSFIALAGLLLVRSLSNMVIFAEIPTFFRMYVTTYPQASFPLFPWSVYYFAGYIITHYFMIADSRRQRALQYLLIGPLLMGIVYASSRIPWSYYDASLNWWLVSPMHMLFRIAGVLTLFAALYLVQDHLKGPISRMLSLSGKESLVIYVGQGIIIYGAPISGEVLLAMLPVYVNPWHIFILTLSVTCVVYGYAYAWNTYKRNLPKHAEWSLRLSMFIYVISFLFKKH